ncbi:hypothetical protein JZ751_007054 [Albula glossodonta]|uniref:Uncharacterized protein n=1 Tax=Albula glossodonta TaxID=121402 RepID=A0A8T2P4K0_9TELE|nr:hypothetical protein JZ751_007054 [Albula glossodonta]
MNSDRVKGNLVQLLLLDTKLTDPREELMGRDEEAGNKVLDEGIKRGRGEWGPLGEFGARARAILGGCEVAAHLLTALGPEPGEGPGHLLAEASATALCWTPTDLECHKRQER